MDIFPDQHVPQVLISQADYDSLLEDRRLLQALQNSGVDNWAGYEYAMDEFHGRD